MELVGLLLDLGTNLEYANAVSMQARVLCKAVRGVILCMRIGGIASCAKALIKLVRGLGSVGSD